MALENFLSGYFLTFVLDAPEKREIIRRQLAGLLHRHLTSPPSLWPGCELQKYHYPCICSTPCRLQSGISGLVLLARTFAFTLKPGQVVLAYRSSGSPCGNVPDDCLFSCQGSMSFDNPILPKKEALSRMSERLDKSSKSSFFYAFGQGCDILEKARNYRRKEPIPCRQNSPFRKN